MAEVTWIKICTDIFDNKKIKQIEVLPEGDQIIIIWFKLLTLAGQINDSGRLCITKDIPYTDQMLSTQFNRPINIVQLALNVFSSYDMIEVSDGVIRLSSWEDHQNIDGLERIREQNRLRKQKQREREKEKREKGLLPEPEDMSRDLSREVTQQNKNKIKNNIYSASEDARQLFEKLWQMYPKKKGKNQIKLARKKELLKVGEAAMMQAIERYAAESEGKEMQYILNGSTFFNGRYMDYLDGNYEEPEPAAKKNKYGW